MLNSQVRFAVYVSAFPVIQRLNTALLKRPEFAETHPAKMPDCPPGYRSGNPTALGPIVRDSS